MTAPARRGHGAAGSLVDLTSAGLPPSVSRGREA
jgi:hypothetical protein